jgi:L-2-hydroxyglutarate oxidase LhgO
MHEFMKEAGSPFEWVGGMLIAWNDEQFQTLSRLLEKAHKKEDIDVYILDKEGGVYRREPHLAEDAMGGMFVRVEGFPIRSGEFRQNVNLQLAQAGRVLYQKSIRLLHANASLNLSSEWVAKVNFTGEPVQLVVRA